MFCRSSILRRALRWALGWVLHGLYFFQTGVINLKVNSYPPWHIQIRYFFLSIKDEVKSVRTVPRTPVLAGTQSVPT